MAGIDPTAHHAEAWRRCDEIPAAPYSSAMLETAEHQRQTHHVNIDRAHKAAMGQFMTPASTARFMASLFPQASGVRRLLDAGAGLGALTCAVLDGWTNHKQVEVVAYELDGLLRPYLVEILDGYAASTHIHGKDFLADAARKIWRGERAFTHAILNPPYKKISSHSQARHTVSRVGLETVNLYSAFVGLALALLADGGQLVAIIPRSFCNGPYYRPFREWLLHLGAIRHIHLPDYP